MKEIMVIKDEEAIDEWNRTIAQFIDVDNKIYKAEFIKVPETFSDLLTLCKNTKGCFVLRISNGEYIEVPTDLIGYSFTFYQDGRIFTDEDICIKEKATPAQMWQIIKNLIGEE